MAPQAASLRPLLDPQSIAIFGASNDLGKINGRPLKYLLEFGFKGKIFPINPKYPEIAGLPCYPSLEAIQEQVDLAVVAVPAKAVLEVLGTCAHRRVGAAVVFSSGFAEMGDEGRAAQQKIAALARDSGMAICGPNSLGIANLATGMTASFSQTLERKPPSGPAAFVTQSGAFGTFLFGLALESGLAFKYFVSSGNEADVELCDYIDYILDDPNIKVIAGYVEGLKDGRKLRRVARKAACLGKPIVVVKVGRSSAGTRAARSHTGSMTGSDAVYAAAFEEGGIIRADTEEQLLDYVATFVSRASPPKGRGVGIITQSGGAGVLASDRCEQAGLTVPELSEESRKALAQVVPAFGATGNPVDVTAQFIAEPSLLRDAVTLVDRDPAIDSSVFCLGLMDLHWRKVVEDFDGLSKALEKPLFVSWTAAPREAVAALRAAGVPVFPTPTRTIDAVAAAVTYVSRRQGAAELEPQAGSKPPLPPEAEALIQKARQEGRDHLLECEAKRLLQGFDISVPRGGVAASLGEALALADSLGYPVALKAQAVGLLHKSDARVIELNLRDQDELARAYARVMANASKHCSPTALRGVLVEEMVLGGSETIVGLTYDPTFGPAVLFGLGGIFTELLRDVVLGLCPVRLTRAEHLIQQLRGYPMLEGARGRPKSDVAALARTLVAVSRMALALEGVAAELDINPLLVLPEGQGVRAADALITLK